MNYMRGGLSAVTAVLVAFFGPVLLAVLKFSSQQKATGFGVVFGRFPESLLSPRFWILAVSFFVLFLAASRLSSKVLRVALFWIPAIACSTIGFGLIGLFTYLWMNSRKH